jgi:hypothetical protein
LKSWDTSASPEPNVLIHCLNIVLLYLLIRKVGGSATVASITDLIFMIHLVNTGAISWFADRKTICEPPSRNMPPKGTKPGRASQTIEE